VELLCRGLALLCFYGSKIVQYGNLGSDTNEKATIDLLSS
jgi:hypothetical protein